jgi:trigger factor
MNATPTSNPLERTITFSVSIAALEEEITARVRHIARTAKLQGFRPGKAPLKMIEQMYGGQVRQEVMNDKLGESFGQSVTSQQFRVAGQPRIEALDSTSATPTEIAFKATFEVYPEVTLGDLGAQPLIKHETSIGDEDVDRTLMTLRKQRTTFANVERACADGDMINVDFVGRVDGVAFEGGSAQNFGMVLGDGRMLPDFEAGVMGMAPAETKTFDVSFPADYAAEALRGKTAQFEVTVNSVAEPLLPELNAEFAKTLGVADGNLEQLRVEVKQNLEREAKKRVINLTKEQVMDAIASVSNFAVPQALVDTEVSAMQAQAIEDLKSRGMTTENMNLPADLFLKGAERRVKLGLAVREIIAQNKLTADARSVRTLIEEHAESFEQPAELVKWYYTQPEKIAEVEALVLEQKVVDWAAERMQSEVRATPFNELMGSTNRN